jgi:hypothetical protein
MWAMSNGRCRIHGGTTPHGFALPQTKTGEHSRYLPTRLAERYEEMLSDPELLTLWREVALLRTRLAELLGKLDDGGGRVAHIRGAYTALCQAMAAQDRQAAEAAFDDLDRAINAAHSEYVIWEKINKTIRLLTRTTEAERRRLVKAEYVVTMDEAMIFVAALAGIIKAVIKDRETIAIIQGRVQQLVEEHYSGQDSHEQD